MKSPSFDDVRRARLDAEGASSHMMPPATLYDVVAQLSVRIELMFESLHRMGAIDKAWERRARMEMAPMSDWCMLNAPHVQENEKIKMELEVSRLNRELFLQGLGEHIRVLKRE